MRYKCRWLWAVVLAAMVILLFPGTAVADEAPGFLDFTQGRLGLGWSFRTHEALTCATLPFNVHEWELGDLRAQVTLDVVGAVPKLIDISEANVGIGGSATLYRPEDRAFRAGLSYHFTKYGWVGAFATWEL